MKGKNLEIEEAPTYLKEKLRITAKQIVKFAHLVMAIIIVTHLIFLFIYNLSTD